MKQPTKQTNKKYQTPQITEWIVFLKHEYLWSILQNPTATYSGLW